MATYYKNVSGNHIKVELFGIGTISIPTGAKSVEIQPSVAKAINEMAKPAIVLEEVESTMDNPVVTDEDVEEGEVSSPEVDYASMTNKQLKEILDALDIPVHRNANKAELLDLLGVGEDIE